MGIPMGLLFDIKRWCRAQFLSRAQPEKKRALKAFLLRIVRAFAAIGFGCEVKVPGFGLQKVRQ
jgi:hypothetical protein